MTVGDRLSTRTSGLNFVRLCIASVVILWHAFPITSNGHLQVDRLVPWFIGGFFVISGYGIAGARMQTSLLSFLARRMLRLVPAFWICLVVTALVFAPLAAAAAGETYVLSSGLGYIVNNAGLYMTQWGIEGTLQDVPLAGVWNGSLWTVFYELAAYVFAGLLLTIPVVRRHGAIACTALFALIVIADHLARGPLNVTTNLYLNGMQLGAFFVAGMVIYFVRDRIPLKSWLVPASLVVLTALSLTERGTWFGQLPFALLLLWVGAVLPVRIGNRNDFSYGVYIWAFPVQQLIIVAGLGWLGPWGTAVLAFLLVLPLAWASCLFVEKPSMLLGRLVPIDFTLRLPRRRQVDPVA